MGTLPSRYNTAHRLARGLQASRRRHEMAQTPETILVVEDAEGVRKMVCSMLAQSGYNCIEASDGIEAVRLLESSDHVNLVLTDMVMPNMGGSDLARHLSRTHPQLPIVFMSGYNEDPVV